MASRCIPAMTFFRKDFPKYLNRPKGRMAPPSVWYYVVESRNPSFTGILPFATSAALTVQGPIPLAFSRYISDRDLYLPFSVA
jgi:hypothetical protein